MKADTEYIGGAVWVKAIEQFQALYLELGSINFAIELAPEIVSAWPTIDETGDVKIPPPEVMRRWAQQSDEGKNRPISEKTQARIKQKVERFLLAETAMTVRHLQSGARHYVDLIKRDEFDPKMNGTFGSLNQGWTFGFKALTEAKGGTAAARQHGVSVGNVQIVFPDRRKLQKTQRKALPAGQVIEGEVLSRG